MNDIDLSVVRGGFNKHDNVHGEDEWLTPPDIPKSLGKFDLDPCAPIPERRPWELAEKSYSVLDDGLSKEWKGRVWCNPPYGRETQKWLKNCSQHKNAIALVFARTETKAFAKYVWPTAHSIFFFEGRLKFYKVDGTESGPAGAPSVLISYNEENTIAIEKANLKGHLVKLK